jgi:murein L,D-transpeptidase YafK
MAYDCGNSSTLVECVKPSSDQTQQKTKRTVLASGVGLAMTLCLGQQLSAQNTNRTAPQTRIRVPTTATGQAAIGRARGRLQISYDDLGLVFGAPIYVRLIKDQKRLEVWVQKRQREFVKLRSYKICGSSPALGPRQRGVLLLQPEGFYVIGAASLRPHNVAYLGVDLNWPNAFDRAQGWSGTTSIIQAGCASEPHFGLTDQDMEEVYTLVHSALVSGQGAVPVHIFPFEMGRLRMLTAGRSPNAAFWRQLEPAWQAFERTKKPPQVRLLGRRYVISEG